MIILLEEDIRLVNIPMNMQLEKRIISKDEETGTETEKWVWDGYYTSIEGVLKGYLKKSIIKSAAGSLEELAADIKRIEKNIDRAMEELKRG